MPELPEVEVAARNLRAWALGRRIVEAEIDAAGRRIVRPEEPAAVAKALRGRELVEVRRVGKQILLRLEGRGGPLGVISHLGMTGKWLRREGDEPPPSHSRARLALEDGVTLHYRDPRLFGRLRLVPGARFEDVPEVAGLGPDFLESGIDEARLRTALARRRVPVKVVLLDQALLPGVGNIQASEALFRARIDPRRRADALTRAEVKRIAAAILASVRETIAREEGPEPSYVEEPGSENPFQVYGREGEPCPRCRKGRLLREVQGQRSTFFCPRCQR